MVKFMEWLEGKSTRLRLVAGTTSVILWSLLVVGFFLAWLGNKDLNANGGMSLFYAVATFVASVLGIHMLSKPKEDKS